MRDDALLSRRAAEFDPVVHAVNRFAPLVTRAHLALPHPFGVLERAVGAGPRGAAIRVPLHRRNKTISTPTETCLGFLLRRNLFTA